MSKLPYPVNPSAPTLEDSEGESNNIYPQLPDGSKALYGNYQPPSVASPYPTSANVPYPLPPAHTNQQLAPPYPTSHYPPADTEQQPGYPLPPGQTYFIPPVPSQGVPYPSYQEQPSFPQLCYPPQQGQPYPQHQVPPYPQQAFGHHPSSQAGSAAPYPQGHSSSGKETVNLNEGPGKNYFSKSKFLGKAIDKGLQMAEQVLSDRFPAPGARPSSHPASLSSHGTTVTDGNCVGRPSSPTTTSAAKKFAGQSFEELKLQSRQRGVLFDDPEFPASNRLLVDGKSQSVISNYFGRSLFDESSIEWLRPQEICQMLRLPAPQMFVGESDRFDINQGEIGNCWFLAAVANLAENKRCFHRVVPQNQGFGGPGYAGIFHFRFWRFGEWVEIVIDDRLPTRRGQLIYLRSVEKNEFWGALLEKAYAKLHGSYRALEGGLTIEAAVDFTGGIPELIHLTETKYSPERLFYIISKAESRGAFMGCALANSSRAGEAQRLGLQARHAYTITKVVEIRSNSMRGGIPLVRLRNPHGNYKEWRGDWSDDDRNWRLIPSHMRNRLGLTFEDDGEFYMSFRDFLKFFGELEICHLSPDGVDVNDNRKQFEVFHFFSSWKAGSSAGGCGNDGNKYFCMNPQHFINLSDPDPYDDETHCPVVVSIAQKQKKRKSEHAIGFKIFKCELRDRYLDEAFLTYNQSIDRVDTFINLREVSKRVLLPQGRYCIIPCTFSKGEEGDYLLRVFVEKRWGSSESGSGKAVKESMDGSRPYDDDVDGALGQLQINSNPHPPSKGVFGFKKQNKVTGFALKILEQNFPKEMKHLKDFYNWTFDRDSEFDLLRKIVKTS